MRTVTVAAVMLAVALSPAWAGKIKVHHDKGDRDEDAIENAQERVDTLEQKLLDPDLSDQRRERIEETIDAITDKFNLPVDPPPDPEPVTLFQDDFNRGGNTDTLGSDWQETEPNHNFVRIQDDHAWIGGSSTATTSVPLDPGVDYETITVDYAFSAGSA